MKKRTTKAVSTIQRLFPDRLFVSSQSSSLSLRERIFKISQLELLGVPRNLIKMVFFGTLGVVSVLFILLCISYLALGNTYVLPRAIACIPALVYLLIIAYFITREKFSLAAWMLIALYSVLATIILWFWSINAQIGILTLGFVIILSGTIVGARYIIPVTIGVIVLLSFLQFANDIGLVEPDRTSLAKASTFADVASYGIIFTVFALLSWLSRRQMEQALRRALSAEAALEHEKQMLAVRLEKQTRHLREVQLEEMQQLYRFAELGQLSTVVLHELANHLTVLTLDIDDIGKRHQQSEAVANAKESISYLDAMVSQVRRQLQESNELEEFNVIDVIEETIATLLPKATKESVSLVFTKEGRKSDCRVVGDPLRLSQVITIIATNAIDAYRAMKKLPSEPTVEIGVTTDEGKVIICITDHGIGIPARKRTQLFEPFHSTKEKGMGIGLFIARKMTETHFKGTIELDPGTEWTRLIVQIPTYRPKR